MRNPSAPSPATPVETDSGEPSPVAASGRTPAAGGFAERSQRESRLLADGSPLLHARAPEQQQPSSHLESEEQQQLAREAVAALLEPVEVLAGARLGGNARGVCIAAWISGHRDGLASCVDDVLARARAGGVRSPVGLLARKILAHDFELGRPPEPPRRSGCQHPECRAASRCMHDVELQPADGRRSA